MKRIVFAVLALALANVGISQDRAIRDTGGGSTGDGSVVTHVRLTFGDEYSLPIGVLDTSDLVTIYGGAQTANPSTITLPELGTGGTYDGKKIEIRGSSAGESGTDKFIITHATTSTDILVLHCQTGAITGNDTIHSTLGDIYTYYVSNDRYYRYCEEDVVHQVTNVGTVERSDGQPGDIFINSAGDSLAFITHSFPFVKVIQVGSGTAPTPGYAMAETATANITPVGNTWVALDNQTAGPAKTSDWTFSTGTDLYTYSGGAYVYEASFSVCFTIASPTLFTYTFTIRENDVDSRAKAVITTSGTDGDFGYCVSGQAIVTANNTDTFGLGVVSSSATNTNMNIVSSQMVLKKLSGQ